MFRVAIIHVMFANYTYMSFGRNICHVCQPHLYVVWAKFVSFSRYISGPFSVSQMLTAPQSLGLFGILH
jgi:hypothetical protein